MTEIEAIKELKEDISLYDNEITRLDASIGTPDRNLIDALEMAIQALEKQIPKKPIMKPYYKDMEEEYLCCPTCGEILTDRIPMDNKDFYFHCLNCGQKFNWESDEK